MCSLQAYIVEEEVSNLYCYTIVEYAWLYIHVSTHDKKHSNWYEIATPQINIMLYIIYILKMEQDKF